MRVRFSNCPANGVAAETLRELAELGSLLLGFAPWVLFLFLSGHSLTSLERALLVSLGASVVFGFSELRAGFVLQWGSLIFFAGSLLLIAVFHFYWLADHMDLVANGSLAAIVWATILSGRPFALQYAQRSAPAEHRNDPALRAACFRISLFWAVLMTVATGMAVYRRSPGPQATESTYFLLTLLIITSGIAGTTIYKGHLRRKKSASPIPPDRL